MARDVSSGDIASRDRVRKRETFVHWDCVRDSLSNVQHNTRSSTRCVQAKNSGRSKEKGRSPEGFEKDFGHFVSILARIQGSFRQQYRVILGFDIDIGFGINMLKGIYDICAINIKGKTA